MPRRLLENDIFFVFRVGAVVSHYELANNEKLTYEWAHKDKIKM